MSLYPGAAIASETQVGLPYFSPACKNYVFAWRIAWRIACICASASASASLRMLVQQGVCMHAHIRKCARQRMPV